MTRYPQPREQDRLENKIPRCICGQFLSQGSRIIRSYAPYPEDKANMEREEYLFCKRCGYQE